MIRFSRRPVCETVALLFALMLAACGGGADSATTSTPSSQQATVQNAGATQASGNTAVDGINWFNSRRQQVGVPPVVRSNVVDNAAQGHSDYQGLNDTITHTQTAGRPGFTGVNLSNRLTAAGYRFNQGSYAMGEVISATSSSSGSLAAEGLIAAIYHRFVIFEPRFREVGAGAAVSASGYTYFTSDFTANGLGPGIGAGNVVHYPVAQQRDVPIVFFSDNERPDPAPDRNEVGYPISVHADITATISVQEFTLRQRGGAQLPVLLLTQATDTHTPSSAAAIIPIDVLARATTYDVQFSGVVSGVGVNRSWSFTTR